jgi:P4 family phage/plasmid primase-like protien
MTAAPAYGRDVLLAAEALRAARLIVPGQVVELRALKVSLPSYRKEHTRAGYFDEDHLEAMVAAGLELAKCSRGAYFTPNPLTRALLSRRCNRMDVADSGSQASDADVIRRRVLLIDADPQQPADISATDEEKAQAREVIEAVRGYLLSVGFPPMTLADSGNGFHLLPLIDLPNDDPSRELVRNALAALDAKFGTPAVKIDPKVFNAARITKLYGTIACKGDSTPERPHRISGLLDVPDDPQPTPRKLLEAVAAEAPIPQPKRTTVNGWTPSAGDRARVVERARRYVAKMDPAVSGQGGHDQTFKVACVLIVGFGLSQDEAWPLLVESNDRCQPAWTESELRHKLTDAGKQPGPRGHLLAGDRHAGNGRLGKAAGLNGPGAGEGDQGERPAANASDSRPGAFRLTDLGNAQRMVARHGRDLRYCYPWESWLVWDGRRWKQDDTGEVERRAKETVRSIYDEAAAEADADRRQVLAQHTVRSEAAARIGAMIALATSEPGVPVLPEQLDTHHDLLSCPNGVLDLRTGELRPHRREDLLTKLCSTPFDDAAACPTFEAFILKVFAGDREMVKFVQRLMGRCLTGDVTEQVLGIFWGGGSNGKSTLLNAVQETIGPDFATAAPPQLLMAKGDRHPCELADLFGRRLMVAMESGKGSRLNETLVKQLTGSDPITARRMRENFWTFKPTHKLILCTNHKPRITGTDLAIWRRVRLVPFQVQFWNPDEAAQPGDYRPEGLRQDKGLPAKLWVEAPGILAWLVTGCLDWRENGLGMPPAVAEATASYRDEQDLLGTFLAECCVRGVSYRVRAGWLYEHSRKWAEAGGEKSIPSQRDFGMSMTERGFTRYTDNGTWYKGVALQDQELAA